MRDCITVLCDRGLAGTGAVRIPNCADQDAPYTGSTVLLEMEATRHTPTCQGTGCINKHSNLQARVMWWNSITFKYSYNLYHIRVRK